MQNQRVGTLLEILNNSIIKQVERDNRKKLLSNDNNIVLIEIKYNQENNDLEKMKDLICKTKI